MPDVHSAPVAVLGLWGEAAGLDEGQCSVVLVKNFSLTSTQENNSVTELREKIKTFLASQGMIKGHSGSGPRSNEGEPQILTLVDNLQPQQPSSPPTPTLSSGSNDGHRPPQGPVTSYVRDAGSYHHPPPGMPADQQHPYAPPPSQTSMYPPQFSYPTLGSNFMQPGPIIFQS